LLQTLVAQHDVSARRAGSLCGPEDRYQVTTMRFATRGWPAPRAERYRRSEPCHARPASSDG